MEYREDQNSGFRTEKMRNTERDIDNSTTLHFSLLSLGETVYTANLLLF